MNRHFGHTGDVQFISINELPKNVIVIKPEPVAYGEKSGHIHVLTGDYELFKDDNFYYAKVGEKGAFSQHVHIKNFDTSLEEAYRASEILHKADHNPGQLLPNTTYKIGIHREYNIFKNSLVNVVD